MSRRRKTIARDQLTYKGRHLNISYAWAPEPNDFESPLIQRCATAIDLGVEEHEVLQLCLDAGQDEAHARLTYIAAKLLRQNPRGDKV